MSLRAQRGNLLLGPPAPQRRCASGMVRSEARRDRDKHASPIRRRLQGERLPARRAGTENSLALVILPKR
jgi:hypothetical protein